MTTPPDLAPDVAALAQVLGHDLRAALSDVIGGLRLIDGAALPPQTLAQLDRARAASEAMARLLEDGLAGIHGTGTGTPDASPPVIQVDRVLADLTSRWSGRAQEKGLNFQVLAEPGLPRVLRADRAALDRILSNLIGNAIRFAGAGQVQCRVWAEPAGRLCFAISDQGPGFSAQLLAELSTLPADPRAATARPAFGMGLRIARQMAGRMRASLRAENTVGHGARVTLCLPAAADPVEMLDAASGIDLSHLRLLLAEDSHHAPNAVSRQLTRFGAEIVLAADGIEALGRLERERFEAVIVDCDLPRLSGLQVIRALRAFSGPLSAMPIVALSAQVQRPDRAVILQAGADAIVQKPVRCPFQLGNAVLSAIGRRTGTPGPQDLSQLVEVLPDQAPFLRLMVLAGADAGAELLARLQEDLHDVERGLITGVTDTDWLALRAHSHVLVALAGAVGAAPLQTLAEALNAIAHAQDAAEVGRVASPALAMLDTLIGFITDQRAALGRPE